MSQPQTNKKGAISFYGLGGFPVTLCASWEMPKEPIYRFLDEDFTPVTMSESDQVMILTDAFSELIHIDIQLEYDIARANDRAKGYI